jgi:hypothetical protein
MSKRPASGIKLWQHVRDARQKLRDLPDAIPKDTGDLEFDNEILLSWISLDGLRGAWNTLNDKIYKGKVERVELEKTAENPLATLMTFVTNGVYPPPELLAGLLTSWKEYMSGSKKTLEEAFLGPSAQGAGPYRKREKKDTANRHAIGWYRTYRERGMSQVKAAEQALRRAPGCKLSVESLARVERRPGQADYFEDLLPLFQVMAARPPLRADKKRRI